MKLLEAALYTDVEYSADYKLGDTNKLADDLYLALIAITGFCNEFSYARDLVSSKIRYQYGGRDDTHTLLPFWGKDRTESDINALEVMVHFMINLMLSFPDLCDSSAADELEDYIALLNDADKDQGTMSKSEARASEDYLRKVTEGLVQRGPISFAMFKDIVANPLIWEKYHRPERQTEATDKYRSLTNWKYALHIYADKSQKPSALFYHSIPFSDSFQLNHFINLHRYIQAIHDKSKPCLQDFVGPVDSWFLMHEWLKKLTADSIALPLDKPYTALYAVMDWWCSYDIDKEMSLIAQEVRRPEDCSQPLPRNNGETTTLPSPCQCGICKRSSCVPDTDKDGTLQPIEELSFPLRTTADFSSQHRCQHNPATESFPLPSRSGLLKRKLEELEPRPQIIPLPRRYRDNTAEDTEPGSSLGPVRKKQRTSLSLESDASDADAIITEVDEESTESDTGSEDAMSVNEDFWSAKSKLSLLAIED